MLTSCGYLAGDEKQQLEQAWLAKDQQLQQAVEQIRTQGLEAVASGAEAGTVASCVATTLVADPVGRLISVEGALVESAKVSQLLADLQQVMEQDVSLEQMAGLLQRGADAAVYAKTLIEQHRLRVICQPYGIIKIDSSPTISQITFMPNPPIDAMRIIELIQKNKHIKLAGNDKLKIERTQEDVSKRVQLIREVIRQLGAPIQKSTPSLKV